MWTLLQPFPERTPPNVTIFPSQRTPDMLIALGAEPLVLCLVHSQLTDVWGCIEWQRKNRYIFYPQ